MSDIIHLHATGGRSYFECRPSGIVWRFPTEELGRAAVALHDRVCPHLAAALDSAGDHE